MKRDKRHNRSAIRLAALQALSDSVIPAPRILVYDDDPVFRKAIATAAQKRKVEITVVGSVGELQKLTNRNSYTAALIDYYVGNWLNGSDLASVMGATPVVMMSGSKERCLEDNSIWPPSVRKFVSKQDGYDELLDAAIKVSI